MKTFDEYLQEAALQQPAPISDRVSHIMQSLVWQIRDIDNKELRAQLYEPLVQFGKVVSNLISQQNQQKGKWLGNVRSVGM